MLIMCRVGELVSTAVHLVESAVASEVLGSVLIYALHIPLFDFVL